VERDEADPRRAAIEVAHDAFLSMDHRGRVLDWNARARELFGYSYDEAVGVDAGELIVPPRFRDRHRTAISQLMAPDAPPVVRRGMHLRAIRRDGGELPVDVTAITLGSGEGRVLHAWVEDMSERAALLDELQEQLRRGSPGFAEIFDALAEAVTIRDRNDHIIYANRAACEHMGFGSLEELQRRPPRAIMDEYLVTDESGAELSMNDVPSVRLLSGDSATALVMRTIHRATGRLRWNLLKSAPLHGPTGERIAAVTIIEDVTLEKQAELRERFLAKASETLMSSIDYEETLRNVAWLAVPEIADWCAVDLIDETGARQRVAVAHRDPAKLALAEQIRRYEPEELHPDRGIGRVMRAGEAELYPVITDEMLAAGAVNAEHLELLRTVGMRSVVLAPLRARGRSFGAMTLVTAESLRRFDQSDREFAQQIAARAAVAVDNARLATARRETARTLQRSLLPEVVPEIEGWEIAALYRSADVADEIEVGGDFYDFLRTDDGWIVLIGDVTGKGIDAAVMTSLVRHGARFLSRYEHSPSRILAGLNEALRERPGLWLCTALCLRLESERVVVCSAGHPPPVIVRDDGRVREIGGAGPILGAWTDQEAPDRTVSISPRETLLLYTDGVIDTAGEADRFGTRRLRRLLAEHARETPSDLLAALDAELQRFSVMGRSDDTAALALRALAVPSVVTAEPAAGGVF
jgi:PAS domain S-box-containing protein